MANDLLGIAALLWIVAGLVALTGCMLVVSRALLALGGLAAIAAAIVHLPLGTGLTAVPLRMAGETAQFQMLPEAFWLMGFGLVPAVLACVLATPSDQGRGTWLFGAACSLLGALGVFGLQHGGFFLLAWESMSLGGAIMILGERLAPAAGQPVLFMLGMLEVGAVALLVAFLLFAFAGDSLSFEAFARVGTLLPLNVQIIAGLLLIIGFGAKLGLLPFYEWFPVCVWFGQRCLGRDHVRRGAECGVLRTEPQPVHLASGRAAKRRVRAWHLVGRSLAYSARSCRCSMPSSRRIGAVC